MSESGGKDTNKINAYFDNEDNFSGCLILIGLFIGFPSIFFWMQVSKYPDPLGILIGNTILYILFPLFCSLFTWLDSNTYCDYCKRRVHPIFKKHICEIDTINPNLKLNNIINSMLKPEKKEIKQIILNLDGLGLFNDNREKQILHENLVSLRKFELIRDYKYVMVSMGAIVEFILVKFCKKHNFPPKDYIDSKGKVYPFGKKPKFVNYVQSAIDNNILGLSSSWRLIQDYLRNFRNYVHIEKEIKEEIIDEDWYKTMKGVFKRILLNFK